MNIIFDFDSTISKAEALDVLAELKIQNGAPTSLLTAVERITQLGMSGEISFEESLERRLDLLNTSRKDIEHLTKIIARTLTTDFAESYINLIEESHEVIIISGGFKDFIDPVLEKVGIPSENIYANHFIFDKKGNYLDFNRDNPLSASGGKVELVQSLGLKGKVVMVGDGYTDLEVKLKGACDVFIAFTEHVRRENVVAQADFEAKSMKEVLKFIESYT